MKEGLANYYYTLKYISLINITERKHEIHLGNFPTHFFLFSTSFLIYIFSSLLITTVGFLLNINISDLHFPLAIAFTIVLSAVLTKHVLKNGWILSYLVIFLWFGISLFVCTQLAAKFYDLSYDGQSYHQETIIALAEGWNPTRTKLTPETHPQYSYTNFLTSYPKASEIIETTIYKFTNNIESAKALNFILAIMTFFYVLSFLLRIGGLSKFVTLIFAVITTLTPITIIQSLSFYIDAHLYFLLVSLIAVLASLYISHKNYFLVPIAFILPLLWTIKVTAIFTSLLIIVGFVILVWYSEKVLLFFKVVLVTVVSAILGLFIIGFNPYVTNTMWFNNPLFPAAGKGAYDFVSYNIPANMYDKNSLQRLVISTFSQTSMARGPQKYYTLKTPFTYEQKEVDSLFAITTIGGFGPFFGGVITLSILGIILILTTLSKDSAKKPLLFTLFILIVSCAIIPVSSYARFIPQFWLIPCLVVLILLNIKNLGSKLVGLLLLGTIFYNLYLVTNRYYTYNYQQNLLLNKELSELKLQSKSAPLNVTFDIFRSNRIRFAEEDIAFKEYRNGECKSSETRILAETIPEAAIKLCNSEGY